MLKNKEVTNRVKGSAESLKEENITQIQPQQVALKLRIGKDGNYSGVGGHILKFFPKDHRVGTDL